MKKQHTKSPLYYELNTNKKNIKFNYIFNEWSKKLLSRWKLVKVENK